MSTETERTMSRDVRMAVMMAYGHLWHINNEPAAPIALYEPEKAAHKARLHLRDLLTKEERGEAISQVGFLIGRYDQPTAAAYAEAPEPLQEAAAPLSHVSEPDQQETRESAVPEPVALTDEQIVALWRERVPENQRRHVSYAVLLPFVRAALAQQTKP